MQRNDDGINPNNRDNESKANEPPAGSLIAETAGGSLRFVGRWTPAP